MKLPEYNGVKYTREKYRAYIEASLDTKYPLNEGRETYDIIVNELRSHNPYEADFVSRRLTEIPSPQSKKEAALAMAIQYYAQKGFELLQNYSAPLTPIEQIIPTQPPRGIPRSTNAPPTHPARLNRAS